MAPGWPTGRTDLRLTESGERAARELGSRLAGLRVDRILSSPLQRARRTAELVQLATASLSVLGYDHDLTEPVKHAWNGRPEIIAFP